MNDFDEKMRDETIPKLWVLIVTAKNNLQVSEMIGNYATQINTKGFGELWGYVQMNADRLYAQQIAMIFEKERKNNPLYSIPAIYQKFHRHSENEVFKCPQLKEAFLEDFEKINTFLNDAALKKFKEFRDRKAAHAELIGSEAHKQLKYLPSIQNTGKILDLAMKALNVFSDAYGVVWDWPILRAAPSVKRALIGLNIIDKDKYFRGKG